MDTGYLYALFNLEDKHHESVKHSYTNMLEGSYGIPILLDYVFDEFVTLVQARTNRNDLATELGNTLLEDSKHFLQFARVSKSNFDNSWELFQNQQGKKFLSFTDCILINFAKIHKVKRIASLDGQFKSWVETIP